MGSGNDGAFDMFASRPSFTDRFSLIASERSHIDPVDVYAAFVIGISERAIETSAAIAYADRDEEKTPTVQGVMREMGDALKYVIRSLETASDEWVAETVDYVLSGLEMDTDEDDEGEEGDDEEAGEPEGGEGVEEEEGDDEEEEGDEICAEEIASLKAKIAEAVATWDEWESEDQILASLKANFAESFSKVVEDMERIDETETV